MHRYVPAALILTPIVVLGCGEGSSYAPGGPHYYKSWANYDQPYRPVDEITPAQAKDLAAKGYAYYIAHFDSRSRIISFEKIYQSKREMKVEYRYKDGVIAETRIDKSGKTHTRTYKE